jgi:hypothetical protein
MHVRLTGKIWQSEPEKRRRTAC